MKFLWFLAAAGSFVGAWILFGAMSLASSAPQEAAVAAIAAACAVVPYVFARACQMYDQVAREKQQHEELIETLRALRNGGGTPEKPASAE